MKLLALGLALLPLGALAAPDERILGKAAGYPACTLQQMAREQSCLVGTLSNFDHALPSRKVAKPDASRALKRVEKEPAALRVDEFLEHNRNTGLLVLKGDTILAERYQYERKPEHRFQSYSMAKTVVAMLVGIAIAEGKIASIDDPAGKYVPELKDELYGKTSLRHLLTMSSGVHFSERYDGRDDISRVAAKSLLGQGPGGVDSVRGFRDRANPAGTKFNYASSETQVLGLALRAAVGKPLAEYLSEKIWVPMGAEAEATWQVDAGGYETGFMGINATLRDWGRLGLLLADGGARDGRQIIPAAWVKAATTPESRHLQVGQATARNGYGYQTWLIDNEGRFALMGVRGQGVFVDPATRLVIVHTAVHAEATGAARAPQFRFFFETLRTLGSS